VACRQRFPPAGSPSVCRASRNRHRRLARCLPSAPQCRASATSRHVHQHLLPPQPHRATLRTWFAGAHGELAYACFTEHVPITIEECAQQAQAARCFTRFQPPEAQKRAAPAAPLPDRPLRAQRYCNQIRNRGREESERQPNHNRTTSTPARLRRCFAAQRLASARGFLRTALKSTLFSRRLPI